MNYFSLPPEQLLLSAQTAGLIWAILLFSLCFLAVHVIKLAKLGWEQSQKKPPEKQEKKEEKPAPAQTEKPVYYLVEKRRRYRRNEGYGEPKQIHFK